MFVLSTSRDGFTPSPDYFRSKQGILRIAEAVISLCGIICYSQTDFCKSIAMYNFVVIVTLILAILIMVVSLFEATRNISYNRLVVFINDIVFSVLYLIVTILSFLSIDGCWTNNNKGARTAQSVFGVGGTVVVGCLAILGYMELKESKANANPNPNAVVVEQNSAPTQYQPANSNLYPNVNQPAPTDPAFVVPLPKVNLNVNVPLRF